MRLPKTISENSFDINFCIFILCQLYILLDFKYLLQVSGILTLISIFISVCGLLYALRLKRMDPDRDISFDIFKNVFIPIVLCVTWLLVYDDYTSYKLNPIHFY